MMSDVNGSDRVLFLVNTYMQLITAIQLRLTLEKNAAVEARFNH